MELDPLSLHWAIWCGVKLIRPEEEKDHPNQISTSARIVVRLIGQLDNEVVREWVVGVVLCVADVSRVLGDGILDQDQ